MKDPGVEIQTKYYELLSGITYNGKSVPVYDVAPYEAEYPHIMFQGRELIDRPNKTSYGNQVFIGLRIIDRFPANNGTRKSIYEISSEVKTRIRKINDVFEVENFNIINAELAQETFVSELTKTYFYYRSEIRFKHLIEDKDIANIYYSGYQVTYDNDNLIVARYGKY